MERVDTALVMWWRGGLQGKKTTSRRLTAPIDFLDWITTQLCPPPPAPSLPSHTFCLSLMCVFVCEPSHPPATVPLSNLHFRPWHLPSAATLPQEHTQRETDTDTHPHWMHMPEKQNLHTNAQHPWRQLQTDENDAETDACAHTHSPQRHGTALI